MATATIFTHLAAYGAGVISAACFIGWLFAPVFQEHQKQKPRGKA